MRHTQHLLAALLLSAPASLLADPLPVLSCASCFTPGQISVLGVNALADVNFDESDDPSVTPASRSPISGSDSAQVVTSTANLSYNLSFNNGFQFSEYAINQGEFAQASLTATLTDYLFVANATPGSTVSVDSNLIVSGTSTPITFYTGSHDFIGPTLFVTPPTSQNPAQTMTTPCFADMQVDFNGSITTSCTVSAALPANGILMLTYEVDSSAVGDSANSSASLIAQRAFLSNIQVDNAAGDIEGGVQIYSASGTNYNAAITPEPNPIVLIGSAGLLLLLSRHRATFYRI